MSQHIVAPAMTISDQEEQQWRTSGYVIVDGFDVTDARRDAVFSKAAHSTDFGSKDGSFEFPCGLPSLDDIPIRLQGVAQRLLRHPGALLSQADVWIKEPKTQTEMSNDDQRIHCDFGNNTLLPGEWNSPNAMAAIVYFDGPEECAGGATAVVARRGDSDPCYKREAMLIQAGYGGRPFFNNRSSAEAWFEKNRPEEFAFRKDLYSREVMCYPKIGRVLLYRLDVWHRGTPLLRGRRRVMNLVFLNPSDPGHAGRWNPGFWKNSYWWVAGRYAPPDALFVRMTPEQRQLLGFPGRDSPYWSVETLRLVALRLPGFDSRTYPNGAAAMQKLTASRL